MKLFLLASIIALMGLTVPATAQLTDEPESDMPAQQQPQNLKQEQRQLELQLRQSLRQVDSQLNAAARILQDRAAVLDEELREELEARKPILEAARQQLKDDLRLLRSRSATEWTRFKMAVSERLEELQQELEE